MGRLDLWSGTFVKDHPGRAELVPELGKAEREKSLLHGHEDRAAVGEPAIISLRLVDAAGDEGKIRYSTSGLSIPMGMEAPGGFQVEIPSFSPPQYRREETKTPRS